MFLVAGKVHLGSTASVAEITCVARYADVYDAGARETLLSVSLDGLRL